MTAPEGMVQAQQLVQVGERIAIFVMVPLPQEETMKVVSYSSSFFFLYARLARGASPFFSLQEFGDKR